MRAAGGATCAVLISGCLIVRADEELIEPPCPTTAPQLLADASGPFAIADAIYFIGTTGVLSRVPLDGGAISELTTDHVRADAIASDATDLYWASDDAIVRKPLDGGAPYAIAMGYLNVTKILVEDTGVVWASSTGIDRWSKLDQTITHLDDASFVLGLGVSDGVYYFSDTRANAVRRIPGGETIASARFPGALVVDERGVYFYEAGDPFTDYSGALRLVPRDGGEVVTTAEDLSIVIDLAADDTSLYFVAAYDQVYRIKHVSRFGGTVRTLACGKFEGQAIFLTVVDEFVYWSDGVALVRMDKTGVVGF